MRFTLRRLSGAELDPELVALGVLSVAAGFGFAWLALRLPTPVCMFHALTGWPCLTCGGTRSMKNLLAGQVGPAFAWNPLAFFSAIVAALFMFYAAVVTAFNLPRLRIVAVSSQEMKFLRLGAILALAANWIYLLHRFSHLA